MHGYVAFHNGKRIELRAETLYAAQKAAAAQFKVKASKAYQVTVYLAELDGETVTHVGL